MYIVEHKGISINSVARIQGWSLFLSNYQYDLTYRPGCSNSNADAFSRLLQSPNDKEEQDINFHGINLLQLDNLLVNSNEVKKKRESRKDNTIACVTESVLTGNWETCRENERFKDFVCGKNELSVERDILLWIARVINSSNLSKKVLYQLHNCHSGVSRMKAHARGYIWWPNINRDTEQTIKNCQECKLNANNSTNVPFHPWEWAEKPWLDCTFIKVILYSFVPNCKRVKLQIFGKKTLNFIRLLLENGPKNTPPPVPPTPHFKKS